MADESPNSKLEPGQVPEQFRCQCCNGDTRVTTVQRKIRVNRKWKMMGFCCTEQGGMYQMGCEG